MSNKSVENNKFDINLSLEGDNKPDLDYLFLKIIIMHLEKNYYTKVNFIIF